MPDLAVVVRTDTPMGRIMNAMYLVRGDIIKIKAGDKIPADVRVMMASDDFRVDQACFTGEPDVFERKPLGAGEAQKNPLDALNLCFSGTSCFSGTATCIVVNIGDATVNARHIISDRQMQLEAVQQCGTCLLI